MSDIDTLKKIKELERRLNKLERLDRAGVLVDYSATSTVVGWSSTTQKYISYVRDGRMMFVHFYIGGTSDNATTSFTLPFTSAQGDLINGVCRVMNNGTWASGIYSLANAASTVSFYATVAAGAFTASGTKTIIGTLSYYCTA